jgi:beta-glucosidase
VIVTENGIATEDDSRRIVYLEAALTGLARCLSDGLDVRGYFHWTLLDNFEWLFGYVPKFGLIAVDRKTLRRTLKPSAKWLGEIARKNTI